MVVLAGVGGGFLVTISKALGPQLLGVAAAPADWQQEG